MNQPHIKQMLSEQAADWLQRLNHEPDNRATREQFVDWLRESPQNVAEVLRADRLSAVLKEFKGWEGLPEEGIEESSSIVALPGVRLSPDKTTSGKKLFAALAAAASLALMAFFLWPVLTGQQIIQTGTGERRQLTLEDGSTLRIAPESRLRVAFTADRRDLILINGAAIFRVAKDPRRPFSVQVADTRVRALGTEFGIERSANKDTVTVSEGVVSITVPSPPKGAMRGQYDRVVMTAGSQLTIASAALTPIRQVNPAQALSWADGRLIFQNDPLAEVIERFNRYNHLRIELTDPALARRTISGVFDATDPESFVEFLATAERIQVRRGKNTLEVSGRGGHLTPQAGHTPAP